jgi:tetratricopeptide (TPR) repeat protein
VAEKKGPETPMNMQILERAVAFHQRGELVQAEQLYAQVLQEQPDQFDALHMLGVIRFAQCRYDEALTLIAAALKANPESARAHANYGRVLSEVERHEEALVSFNRALAIMPQYPLALRARGNALGQLDRHAEALASYEHALALAPNDAETLHERGVLLAQMKRYPEALASFDKALTVARGYWTLWHSRGNVLSELERYDEALASYDRALALKPDYAEALYGRGHVLQALKRDADALLSYDKALAIRPDFPEVLNNLGSVLSELRRRKEALASLDKALALRPDYAEALVNRGNVLNAMKRYEEALASYDRALALKPDFADALYNRGEALTELGRHAEALASYDRALALRPDNADALNNRGTVLQALSRYDEALACFERAIAVAPAHAKAHWNIAADRLAVGDFARGWNEYEWRRAVPEFGHLPRSSPQPLWNGDYVKGALLVWGEQGLGDEILYAGMIPDLMARADTVVVETEPRLVPLFARSFPGVRVVGRGEQLGDDIKAQMALGSLAQYLRLNLAAFPYRERGYLVADAERAAKLRQRLSPAGQVVMGLSWISKNPLLGKFKTARLRDFEPLLRLSGCRFVDLQYGDTGPERAALEQETGLLVERLEDIDNTDDLDGLAALISACDLVVTVSNTIAHLAGALGRPTWVLAPHGYARFWYWFRDRSDSPWYPHVHIKRQAGKESWAETIAAMAGEIAAFVASAKVRRKS